MKFIAKDFYIQKGITSLSYWRNPTKSEAKFGYGTFHHKKFDLNECYTNDGLFNYKFRAKCDGLLYFSNQVEYSIAKKNFKIEEIEMYMPVLE